MRDLTKIKDFSYGGLLGKKLHRWAIRELQSMIGYKADLNEISIFKLKYNESNKLKCSKCGEELETKILTDKLKGIKRFKCEKCNYSNDYHFNDCINSYNYFNEWEKAMPTPKTKTISGA